MTNSVITGWRGSSEKSEMKRGIYFLLKQLYFTDRLSNHVKSSVQIVVCRSYSKRLKIFFVKAWSVSLSWLRSAEYPGRKLMHIASCCWLMLSAPWQRFLSFDHRRVLGPFNDRLGNPSRRHLLSTVSWCILYSVTSHRRRAVHITISSLAPHCGVFSAL